MSDYWNKLPFVLSFGFCKICLKFWNLQIGTKKQSAFIACVLWFLYLLKIFSTLLTFLCLKCLFHMNYHIDKVVYVMFVKAFFFWWNVTSENICKIATNFFVVSCWRWYHIQHILQNPKLWLITIFSSNHSLDKYFRKSLNPYQISKPLCYSVWFKKRKSRIRETKHILTDAPMP